MGYGHGKGNPSVRWAHRRSLVRGLLPRWQAGDRGLLRRHRVSVGCGHGRENPSIQNASIAILLRFVVFSPDGKYVVARTLNKSIAFWDVATGKEIRRWSARNGDPEAINYTGPANSVAFSPDGRHVAAEDMTTRSHVYGM